MEQPVSPLIQIRNVRKILGKKEILQDITIDIYAKEILGVIGGSGAGKTTLFRTLVGFYAPDKGEIWIADKNLKNNKQLIRTIVGFASQEGCFYEELSVTENLTYFGQLYGLNAPTITSRTDELLGLVELTNEKKTLARNLSGGMKKRLDIAIALIHNPKVLIMDEPTTGLDAKLRKSMWELIQRVNERGTTIIISSHMMEDMEHLCTRVCLLFEGKLVAAASPAQLKELYSRNEEIHLESFPGNYHQIIMDLKKKDQQIAMYTFRDHKLIIYTPQAEKVLKCVLEIMESTNEKLMEVSVNKPSLNEVFDAFTQYYGKKK